MTTKMTQDLLIFVLRFVEEYEGIACERPECVSDLCRLVREANVILREHLITTPGGAA